MRKESDHGKCGSLKIYIFKFIGERERKSGGGVERERFVVPLIYAFIHWFLYVPRPAIEPKSLVYWDDILTT